MAGNSEVSFFKVLLGDFMETLKIPPTFVRKFEKIIPRAPTLKPHEGNSYMVVMIENQDGCFFERGWKEFARSNGLKVGDFLVFNLADERSYEVVIYGRHCIPKDINVAFSDNEDIRNKPESCFPTYEVDIKMEEEEEEKQDLPYKEDEINIKRNYHSVEEIKIKKRGRPSKDGNRIKSKGHPSVVKRGISAAKSGCKMGERSKERITERVKSKNPKNPFFVTVIKFYQKYRLVMPLDFARKTRLVSNKTIKMKDPEGVEWPVAVIVVPYHGKFQSNLSSGWGAFYKANKLSTGDICVFHYIAEVGDLVEVNIHRKKEVMLEMN